MAIGTLAAIGLGVAGIGSVVGAKSTSKAAGKAADAQRDASAQNAAVQREIYGQNKQILSPYIERGNVAGGMLQDFYGLTPRPAAQATGQQALPAAQPNALAQYQGANPDTSGLGRLNQYTAQHGIETIGGDVPRFYQRDADAGYTGLPANGNTGVVGPQAQTPTSADAFKRYIENSDYAFQFGEGANRVNSGYAGAGTLQSGAAMKGLEAFRQNLQAGYRNDWASGVANQQGVGLAGASALAGVGQNYANSMTANNNALAGAIGNAALVKGQNNPFAAGLGTLGGGILGLGR